MTTSVSDFKEKLEQHFNEFRRSLATEEGDWVVKGFIDVYRNIYTIAVDLEQPPYGNLEEYWNWRNRVPISKPSPSSPQRRTP